jgi:hypothetical protein
MKHHPSPATCEDLAMTHKPENVCDPNLANGFAHAALPSGKRLEKLCPNYDAGRLGATLEENLGPANDCVAFALSTACEPADEALTLYRQLPTPKKTHNAIPCFCAALEQCRDSVP